MSETPGGEPVHSEGDASDIERSAAQGRPPEADAGGASAADTFEPGQILATLERHGVQYVVMGGYAARLHGAARATRDVDVTPRTTADNLDRLAAALHEMNVRVRTESEPQGLPIALSGESLTGVRWLNLITDFGEVDLTVRPDGFEGGWEDLEAAAVTKRLGSVSVQVAALTDVITSKEMAAREKDLAALPELYALAGKDLPGRPGRRPAPTRGVPRPGGGTLGERPSAAERIKAARRMARESRESEFEVQPPEAPER